MSEENVLLEIVIGTYEKYLLGYKLEMNQDQFALRPSFATEAHLLPVKCIASSEKYLASGSVDEAIRLFNMKTRKEIGALLHHNGTITCLEFHDSYLLSCSEDHSICVWSTSSWQCIKTLLGHESTVNFLAVHPTGKMALSVGKDKTLRTWNLIRGRSTYVTNIKKIADIVRWSPDGSYFLVCSGNTIDIYSVENATVVSTIDFQQKICDFTFVNDDLLAVGGESEHINFYDIKSEEMRFKLKTKANRIKALKSVSVSDETFLVSASSDGCIKVWHMDLSQDEMKARKVAKVKTQSRPTCMAIVMGN
ncbi:p21-activated protein kinase-interacting protein 1-like [Argiope bruennichi]|uniref:p21-activated protein kinase-interacting like protein n=1 Tax=Argiope bruennichi TaxID=94029 RepID=A0A8T0FUA8_ARGBR|nr:p21-activated protein kinase-interacting protein 1-like [Argiope bruennichi]KAF8794262.1 p21-activated protein kinase-interacting like protein [Argiope bruennichi]